MFRAPHVCSYLGVTLALAGCGGSETLSSDEPDGSAAEPEPEVDASLGNGESDAGSESPDEPEETETDAPSLEADACVPATCESLGVQCGIANDGCGEPLSCGECAPAEDDAGGCVPSSCEDLGAECGSASDGCGGSLECGECGADEVCGAIAENMCACSDREVLDSTPQTARRAVSLGFSGTEDEYFELYDIPCEEVSDCAEVCEIRGGTEDMCAASECSGFEDDTECLPATVWRDLENILFEGNATDQAVQLTVVYNPYRDTLVADEFQLELPEQAAIEGITVEIRRAGDETISDFSVKLAKGGEVGGAERAEPQLWTEEFEWITYGGPDDTWGQDWTPQDLMADDFGVALSVAYTQMAGNARAYVDQVRVTAHYSVACDE